MPKTVGYFRKVSKMTKQWFISGIINKNTEINGFVNFWKTPTLLRLEMTVLSRPVYDQNTDL